MATVHGTAIMATVHGTAIMATMQKRSYTKILQLAIFLSSRKVVTQIKPVSMPIHFPWLLFMVTTSIFYILKKQCEHLSLELDFLVNRYLFPYFPE